MMIMVIRVDQQAGGGPDAAEQQRRAEEMLREMLRQGMFGGLGENGFADFFSNLGGMGSTGRGPAKGSDLQTSLSLSFNEAVKGTEKTLNINSLGSCPTCKGSGDRPGSKSTNCPQCRGQGAILQRQGPFTIETTCPHCHGAGVRRDACQPCDGTGQVRERRTVVVNIPAGVDNGNVVRLANQGDAGRQGGPRGHLLVRISVDKHPMFLRDQADVHVQVPISVSTAALGGSVNVPTLTGEAVLKVPSGTQPGDKVVMRGKGIKQLNRNAYGNQYVHFQVEIPKTVTGKLKELFSQLSKELPEPSPPRTPDSAPGSEHKSSDKKRGFWSKLAGFGNEDKS
jgi:molecular chaperone DnaJ